MSDFFDNRFNVDTNAQGLRLVDNSTWVGDYIYSRPDIFKDFILAEIIFQYYLDNPNEIDNISSDDVYLVNRQLNIDLLKELKSRKLDIVANPTETKLENNEM